MISMVGYGFEIKGEKEKDGLDITYNKKEQCTWESIHGIRLNYTLN